MSKIELGGRYKLGDRKCTVVAINKFDGACLLMFDDRTKHDNLLNTSFDEAKHNHDCIENFEISAGFGYDINDGLLPIEIKVKPTRLARKLYPKAKEEDGFLILEE